MPNTCYAVFTKRVCMICVCNEAHLIINLHVHTKYRLFRIYVATTAQVTVYDVINAQSGDVLTICV